MFTLLSTVTFRFHYNVDPVTIFPSGFSTAGRTDYSLNCSSTLFKPSRLPTDVPQPNFQWSFNGSASLPAGVTAMPTVMSSSNSSSEIYTSILQFSPLSQSHIGNYTCRLGAASLVNSAMVTVHGILLFILSNCYALNSLSFQYLPSLSGSLLVKFQCWDKMTTPSRVILLELKISAPL